MKEYIVPLSEDEAFYGYKDVATELVRCKDCIYFRPDSAGCWCGRHSSAYGFALDVCENDFCAWAERKEE